MLVLPLTYLCSDATLEGYSLDPVSFATVGIDVSIFVSGTPAEL